jgi:hypothetical protein
MCKITPNPPKTDPASPYESLDSNKLHEAAERALDHYPQTRRRNNGDTLPTQRHVPGQS